MYELLQKFYTIKIDPHSCKINDEYILLGSVWYP